MPNSLRLPPFLSTPKILVLLAACVLLAAALTASAQENANNANVNNTNPNANNINNAPGNTNRPTNTNGSINQQAGAETPTPAQSPTPDPQVEKRKSDLVASSWYYLLVSLIFAAVLLPFSYSLYRAVRYSKSTYGPLGLPEGSLRALLAFTLVMFLGFYILASVLSLSEFRPPDFLLGIVATVIGFYFGSRAGEGGGAGGGARTGAVEVEVTTPAGGPATGATVELTSAGGKKTSQETGADGKCKFDAVSAGKYAIQAALTGSNPSDPQDVQVQTDETLQVKLQLK